MVWLLPLQQHSKSSYITLKEKIAVSPVVLVRFEVRSSSSLTNGELVARGLLLT